MGRQVGLSAKRLFSDGLALSECTGFISPDMPHSFPFFATRTNRPAFQRGQSLVEYALILALIAVVVVIVLITQGAAMSQMYSNIACGMKIGC